MARNTRPTRLLLARLTGALALLATLACLSPLTARASETLRTLTFRGESFQVPSSWPVLDTAADPAVCVRFNRHAAYLGAPGSASSCPAQIFGAASAIEVERATSSMLADAAQADHFKSSQIAGQSVLVSSNSSVSGRIVADFPQTGLFTTISYRTAAGLKRARQILSSFRQRAHTGSSAGSAKAASTASFGRAPFDRATSTRTTKATLTSAQTTVLPHFAAVTAAGKGFDTCEAPTENQMAAWRAHSPFKSVGVYVGGPNAACFNVTSTWMTNETAAGWDVFPIYVGLQAPCANQGNLASISTNTASAAAQGASDAGNAVANAASLGIGPGATLYDDMEAWNTANGSCNNDVIAFVKGWTNQLHADGYESGVYSSLYSGTNVLESIYGQVGAPDVIYFAYWDGVPTTLNSAIPPNEWPNAQRIKQYASGSWSYGGVSLNIDEDYLNAPAVGEPAPAVSSLTPGTAPAGTDVFIRGSNLNVGTPTVSFGSAVSPHVQVISPTELIATVPAQPATASSSATASASVSVDVQTSAGLTTTTFTYAPVAGMAAYPQGGYLLASSAGNLLNYHAGFYGSARGKAPAPVVSVATTSTGYLLVTSKGNVYNFHTAWYGSLATRSLPAPVVSVAATSTGYLLVTSKGNVYNFHTAWYGSPAHQSVPAPISGIAETPSGGYLLTSATGTVYSYNTASYGSPTATTLPAPVVGIAATSTGYLLTTAAGNVYNLHTPWYGSPASEAS